MFRVGLAETKAANRHTGSNTFMWSALELSVEVGMKTLTSITAPAARTELLDTLSAFLAQLPNQIETAEALAAFHPQAKEPIEHTRFARIASVLVDFREGLAKAL